MADAYYILRNIGNDAHPKVRNCALRHRHRTMVGFVSRVHRADEALVNSQAFSMFPGALANDCFKGPHKRTMAVIKHNFPIPLITSNNLY